MHARRHFAKGHTRVKNDASALAFASASAPLTFASASAAGSTVSRSMTSRSTAAATTAAATAPSLNVQFNKPLDSAAESLVRAIDLNPTSADAHRALASWMTEDTTRSPASTVSRVWRRAVSLAPQDSSLRYELVNAVGSELRHTMASTAEDRTEAKLKTLRKQWLAALRSVSELEGGKYSPNVFNNLGTAFRLVGKDRASVRAYRRAASLLTPLHAGLQPDAPSPEMLRDAMAQLSAMDRQNTIDVVHGLHDGLLYLASAARRRREAKSVQPPAVQEQQATEEEEEEASAAEDQQEENVPARSAASLQEASLLREMWSVRRLAITLGLYNLTDQRPPRYDPRLRPACPWHHRTAYGPLVTLLERVAAREARTELQELLRMRTAGEGDEPRQWYTDHERITPTPSLWLRRHISCNPQARRKLQAGRGQATCAAVAAAQEWWYAPEGTPVPSSAAAEEDATALADDDAPSTSAVARASAVDSASSAVSAGNTTSSRVDEFYLKAQFSLLWPGTVLRPHVGPTNGRLAISIALDGADGAWLRVANTTRAWPNDHTSLVFDDSFEHEVVHGGTAPRAVIIVHFAHPMTMEPGTNGHAAVMLGDAVCDDGRPERPSHVLSGAGAPSLEEDEERSTRSAAARSGWSSNRSRTCATRSAR